MGRKGGLFPSVPRKSAPKITRSLKKSFSGTFSTGVSTRFSIFIWKSVSFGKQTHMTTTTNLLSTLLQIHHYKPVATLKSDWLASRAKIDRSSPFRAHFRLATIVASNPSRDICSGLCRPCPSSCSAPVYWWVYQRATMLDVSLVVHPVVHAVFLG